MESVYEKLIKMRQLADDILELRNKEIPERDMVWHMQPHVRAAIEQNMTGNAFVGIEVSDPLKECMAYLWVDHEIGIVWEYNNNIHVADAVHPAGMSALILRTRRYIELIKESTLNVDPAAESGEPEIKAWPVYEYTMEMHPILAYPKPEFIQARIANIEIPDEFHFKPEPEDTGEK